MKISIIIPIYNESATIHRRIDRLISSRHADEPCEIIVADGHSDGSTVNYITNPLIRKITSLKGRGRQMNAGASIATGDIFLFLHADTLLPQNGLPLIRKTIATGQADAGAFSLGIDSPHPVYRLIEKAVFWRTRLTGIPYGDQAIFMQRQIFQKVGGYAEIPLMEDIDLVRRFYSAGGRLRVLNEKVRTSPRRWEKEGVVFCTLRNWVLVSLYLAGIRPERLARYYP